MNYADEMFIRRCLDLAVQGADFVSPNPMAGCVIVCDDKILGEGYHKKFGGAHAEVNAIEDVKAKGLSHLLPKATLYVNLEPCAHFGRTPPCADLIIVNKIPKVVAGMIDPHEKVNGAGIEKLRSAGVDVKVNVLKEKCDRLNTAFITYHTKKRPYIILKWAQTKDGFIAKKNSSNGIQWISAPYLRKLVHEWRVKTDAVLIGKNTAMKDNPELTVRFASGENPVRVVLDRNLSLPKHLKIFNEEAPTLILNSVKEGKENKLEYVKINSDGSRFALKEILGILYERNILSVIVEGGADVLNQFISENLYDEMRVLTGDVSWGEGLNAPKIVKKDFSRSLKEKIFSDELKIISTTNY